MAKLKEKGNLKQIRFGKRLQMLRIVLNVDISVIAGEIGIMVAGYQQLELGNGELNSLQLRKLADLYGVWGTDLTDDDSKLFSQIEQIKLKIK